MKKNESRRKLLKSIAAGSGAIVAGKSLPESWSKPVVESVMLPAHAQTSQVEPPQAGPLCIAGSLTITDNNSIAIIFDGNTCSLAEIPGSSCGGGCDPDTMLAIDNDSGDFDLNAPYGSNWDATPDDNNYAPGIYSFTKTRTGGANSGNDYTVTFTVSFASGSDIDSDMTVSSVSFEAA